MQFWKNLNNRGKILLLLMISLVLLNTIVLVTTYNLKQLSTSFASILNDRLIPSTDIALIQSLCYENRLYLEDDLVNQNSPEKVQAEIKENNRLIDQTLDKYRLTYFTDEESQHTAQFIKLLQEYRRYELEVQELLAHNEYAAAKEIFYGSSRKAFLHMVEELHQLSGIQVAVGQTLYEHTGSTIQLIRLVAYCSLCISLVVAAHLLMVLGIKSKLVSNR